MKTKSSVLTLPLVHVLFRSGVVAALCTLISACAPRLTDAPNLYVHKPDPVQVSILPVGSTPGPGLVCQTGAQYLLCLNQEPIDLSQDVQPYIQINWYITTSGWAFSRGSGIVVKTPPGNFRTGGGATAQDYLAVSKSWQPHSSYRYTISVTDGTTTLTWDPWIAND